jgi:tRNA(fMet)-specific endonuclease VapC
VRFLLDTNVVGNPASVVPDARIVKALAAHGTSCAIPATVWHELVWGCARLPRGRRRTFFEDYLREVVRPTYPVLPYDEAAAAWHAEERARLDDLGRPAPFADGQIAAVAAVNGLVLVTRNRKDFARFVGLRVTDWSSRARSSGSGSRA